MRKIVLTLTVIALTALLFSTSVEENIYRELDISQYHQANNVVLRVSNYGFFGSGSNRPQWPSLEYPAGSGIDYLFQGALWVGGKLVRRDDEGRRLFWLPDPESSIDVVAEGTDEYNDLIGEFGSLRLAVDTLTTVGFDGDASLYELLPAYNPLEMGPLGQQYNRYNHLDVVLRSIVGYPSPSDATFPNDPNNIFLFCDPLPEQGDFPGLETMTSFYYDYSPFGTLGKRNHGVSAGRFDHFPLGIAVRQQSYAWTFQDLYDMVFFSFDIYNANTYDTLYDVSLAMYMDHDAGPQAWPSGARSIDDVSGYYAGEGYEFAYSRDFDTDDGLTVHWVATKLFPQSGWNFSCYNWTRGDGPDDTRPRRLDPPGLNTANEKYWLMTGRNPDTDKFRPLRPENWTPDMNPHYEEPESNDTRFLYSMYGDMQGFNEPTDNTIYIPPGEKVSIHGVIFFGDDLEHLKERSLIAQAFYDSGYDLSLYDGVPCIPFMVSAEYADEAIDVKWFRGDGADEQYLYYKEAEQPATEWQEIELNPEKDSYQITGIEPYGIYQIKIAAVYDDVYLESRVYEVLASELSAEEEIVIAKPDIISLIGNYPNPFNPDTRILFNLAEAADVTLEVYNIRGQLVRKLIDNEHYGQGLHRIFWNGKNDNGFDVAGGVYLYRLSTPQTTDVRKMIMLK